jgi:hypothetical protein
MSIVESGNGRALKDAKPPLRKQVVQRLPFTYHHVRPQMLNLISISLSDEWKKLRCE